MPNLPNRDPKELIISTQVGLLFARRDLRNQNFAEWEILTESVVVLDKCLKLLEVK